MDRPACAPPSVYLLGDGHSHRDPAGSFGLIRTSIGGFVRDSISGNAVCGPQRTAAPPYVARVRAAFFFAPAFFGLAAFLESAPI